MLAFGTTPRPPGQLEAYTSRTITDRSALAAELNRIRGRGYGYNLGEREDDLHAIAAPVWGSRDELAAVMAVQGPASRFNQKAMDAAVGTLLEHTHAVSLQLGWTVLASQVAET
jgi:DNA-binding IclR family transcriptional regulator